MKQTLQQVLDNNLPIERKVFGSRRGKSIYTKKNKEQSKKKRLMAKASRRI